MDKFARSFRDQFCISENERTSQLWEETASGLQEAFSILPSSLSKVSPVGDTGFYLRIAENSIGRLYETSASMVACLACGASGGVESLARVVIEGAWTTRFLLEGDYKKRMFSYLFQYTREHPRKLAEWRSIVERTRPNDCTTLAAIDGRATYIEDMHNFIDEIRKAIGQPEIEELLKYWTKSLFSRCNSLGEQEKYYTHYHRLSADSHQNAEQTIQYVHGYFMEAECGIKDVLDKIGFEIVHYSAMMAALAVDEAIVAALAACNRFGADYDMTTIDRVRHRLRAHAAILGQNAGSPIKT
ncbi:MAG TPA: DUF5677 domain-containing protein [Chthoniobacterales bacterium]|jgi:hypothetical protein